VPCKEDFLFLPAWKKAVELCPTYIKNEYSNLADVRETAFIEVKMK
jgi:hypothetical protein